jgi:hypothetical protein
MADLSDVEDALVLLVSNTLYPEGLSAPSVVAADCRVYRGWPLQAGLNNDLAAGICSITVFPSSRPGKVLTPLPILYPSETVLPVFTASVSGSTARFSGTPANGHCAGLIVDRVGYVYRPANGDSAGMVAAALSDLVRADRAAHLSGTTVTVPGAQRLVARVVSDQVISREVRRQDREVIIACWCSTPTQRDMVARVIDTTLAQTRFLSMPDKSSARLMYVDTSEYDQAQSALLYRRDLVYLAEYATVVTANDPAMLFGDLKLGAAEALA